MGRPALAFVSEEDFRSLPETLDKVELIDGEVVVSPSPSFFHQEVLGRLAAALRSWAAELPERSRGLTIGQTPMDIRFAPGRILQPDLFVLFERVPLDHEGPLEKVPELCVEVLSARPSYDRFTKRVIYADAGVAELWTLEPGYYAERWTGEGLRRVTRLEAEPGVTLGSELLAGFSIELSSLYAERA